MVGIGCIVKKKIIVFYFTRLIKYSKINQYLKICNIFNFLIFW